MKSKIINLYKPVVSCYKKTSLRMKILAGLGVLLLLLGFWSMIPEKTPQRALNSFYEAVKDSDWKSAYNYIDENSTKVLENQMKSYFNYLVSVYKNNDSRIKTFKELLEENGKDFFVQLMKTFPDNKKWFVNKLDNMKITKSVIQDDKALVAFETSKGRDSLILVKRNSDWKVSIDFRL